MAEAATLALGEDAGDEAVQRQAESVFRQQLGLDTFINCT